MKRGLIDPFRRLNFDGIQLVPVEYPYPRLEEFCNEQYGERWHAPGRQILSTKELIDLANSRGVLVSLTVNGGDGTTQTTSLN